MNTSMNKPVFIITRIIHQAISHKFLNKVSERDKPVFVIKTRVCYWIHEDLHQEILSSTGLRISSILNHRYEVISGINRHLFDIFCEQYNPVCDQVCLIFLIRRTLQFSEGAFDRPNNNSGFDKDTGLHHAETFVQRFVAYTWLLPDG